MIDIPNLKIDRDGNEPDTLIELAQDDGCGNFSYIQLHPVHVRLLAERTGLAPSYELETDRIIAKLSRQMRLLLDRVATLDDWINQAAQRGHENLELEATYSCATWELASEFCADLADLGNAASAVAGCVSGVAQESRREPESVEPALPADLHRQADGQSEIDL